MEISILILGDIEVMEGPSIVQNALFIKDFSNPIDLASINKILKDEGRFDCLKF